MRCAPHSRPCVTDAAVFGSIAGAASAWAGAELLRSRLLWSAGAVLMSIHAVAAFAIFYGWSHDAAVAATARQTAELTGLAWGGGVFFNYALLAVWMGDAAWWWGAPRGYAARPRAIDAAVRGFVFFMFVNGAVIFADGWMRLLGGLAVGAVSMTWCIRWWTPARPARSRPGGSITAG